MPTKNIDKNPAEQFISSVEQLEKNEANIPDGYKLNQEYIEKRTKRIQLVMQPSLYKKAKAAADAEKLSFNSYIHKVLEEVLKAPEEVKKPEVTNN